LIQHNVYWITCWKWPSTFRHAKIQNWNTEKQCSGLLKTYFLPAFFLLHFLTMKILCMSLYSIRTRKTNLRYSVLQKFITHNRWNRTVWKMIQCNRTIGRGYVIRAAAVSSRLHCWQFLDNNLKQCLIIFSPDVKHVWELKEAIFNTWSSTR